MPALEPLAAALRDERIGGLINFASSLLPMALAIWRPRFGRRPDT